MRANLALGVILSLTVLMAVPAYAEVTSVSLVKGFYTTEESIEFEGSESVGNQLVHVLIRSPSGKFIDIVSDPSSEEDGNFLTFPRAVDVIFKSEGTYKATAFIDTQKEEDGVTMDLEFDGDKVFVAPDFVLELRSISDKTVEEGKTLSFTVEVKEGEDAEFSLEKNPPSGALINADTGKFTFTPTSSQAPGSYVFDIVATKGVQIDRETIKITVTEKAVPKPATPTKEPEPEPDEPAAQPKTKEIPAPFVDEDKDPQSYVDRYNTEASYKKWFDANYPEYASIYEAVGLEEPVEIPAPFVDEDKDPQSYVDRYNTEASYKKWFDANYPEYASIYEAVGLEEPKAEDEEPKVGTKKWSE